MTRMFGAVVEHAHQVGGKGPAKRGLKPFGSASDCVGVLPLGYIGHGLLPYQGSIAKAAGPEHITAS
jgi:hypothetical protein